MTDHQGTPTLYLDSTAQNPTWRQYSPYGTPRGVTVAAPDNHGFLDKPMSPTGLTTVGARSYDPLFGRFLSVDPVQDAAQPQQWNGYSYANNTPVTSSDPTGLIPDDCKYFDCYGYDIKKGCPGGCGSTDNVAYGKTHKLSSTKSSRRNGPPRKDPHRPISANTSELGRQLLWNRMLYMNQNMIDGQSHVVNPMDWHEVWVQWLAGNTSETVSFYQIYPMTMAIRG
ncbi:RHS repeat-associated core domain-containing protein [Micromonospora sp. DT4]|uniref:RHS repeat-associated core domain-containing protein n=1 Tax=Micromonospora sp. DT4 TaxID=3393438 RepID=UPI003CF1F72D